MSANVIFMASVGVMGFLQMQAVNGKFKGKAIMPISRLVNIMYSNSILIVI